MATINGKACVATGINLLLDSQTQTKNGAWFSKNNSWIPGKETYLGSNVNYIVAPWLNSRYSYEDLLDRGAINTTDDFTYSIYFRVVGEDPAGMSYADIFFFSQATTKDSNVPVQLTSLKEGQWTRLVVTFRFKDVKYDPAIAYNQSLRVEVSIAPKVAGAYYEFAAPKLELGTTATPYLPAPVDKVFSNGMQVYGRNLLTGTGSHTSTFFAFLSNENTNGLLTLFKGLEGETVTVSVDYEYSEFIAGSGQNRLGWETEIRTNLATQYKLWYYPNNDSGSGRISSTFVVPKNITSVVESMGYIQFSGSGTGTLSHLKLEKGTIATPWTPAPEDYI